ncbi:zinc-dependent alcohol dehydrogenase [Ameyamaea chiangmaiensis NBRC 103196]|uniref:L-idonate 5-dehydrogenase n=1 Tax=Ameyamaea chiangmaiensis TaxID=442969 RepID=A0A850P7T9_9PROT|nr:L-idonate 5-dehydrogenase [Ameyamaea chiangmaiensis]MBS4075333.1 L-idonate 5-dehydrogenase [Ameyamaea chiangmaiensis]NVN40675.1 L-idonate 5-dehydrogenase [Ameyamaea chiangmaiensis]GBQ70149.1 zinc-dependent alcohol dehydrogenase [Ameyamaea chiangmaiensis NBRC 103196]
MTLIDEAGADTLDGKALVIHAAHDVRLTPITTDAPGPGEIRITLAWGGLCGSDLHYFQHGGVGASVLREPMILGHEVSGTIDRLGAGVGGFHPGQDVAIHPARPCGECPECRRGLRHLCRSTRFFGSAAFLPHTDGGFRTSMIVRAEQVRALPPGLDVRRAALAEPLAVALHAIARAGDVRGRSVLVQGAGPIGALVVAGLSDHGAGRIVATDLQDFPLSLASKLGAHATWNARDEPPDEEFDVVFEATGVAAALPNAVARTRRGGILVQVGMFPPGLVETPLAQIISRELDFRGTLRFDTEFDDALLLLAKRPEIADILVTHQMTLDEHQDAFAIGADRRQAAKVLLDLHT